MHLHIQPMRTEDLDLIAGLQVTERHAITRLQLVEIKHDEKMHLVFLGNPREEPRPCAHFLLQAIAPNDVLAVIPHNMFGVALTQFSVHGTCSQERAAKITRFVLGSLLLWHAPDGQPLLVRIHCTAGSGVDRVVRAMPGARAFPDGEHFIYQFCF